MKKQTENTFTEGLVLDLHPLTTPNNVLTDALNATLITMNGNEFVLLNDMGNGRVEKAYLPPGYVPVGIKEFGGVIYVASYNPLTNKGQIGSFPSPERNIDLEELEYASNTAITWADFYDSTKGECKTFVTKVQLFGGKVMRSGDKFTIYFDNETTANAIKLLSNYNNIDTSGNAISPKKNTLSISFTVLDSNNNLRDITSLLKRFKDKESAPIIFDPSTLPVVKENTGYFIEHLGDATPSSKNDAEFVKERQKRAVNTYNNKLFGKIFLTIQLNIIDHIDVSVYGFKKGESGWELPSELSTADLGNNDVVLVFDTEYVYNCPDGFTDGNTLPATIPGYSGYLGKYNYSVIKGVLLKLGNSSYVLNFPTNSPTTDKPYYNQIDNLYNIKLSAYLPLTLDSSNPVFNYTITPWMTYSPLNGLAVDGSIDLSKLGSGENTISTWKYYCDNDKVRLTWGFNSYPSYGTKITDVVFHFYDILNGINETDTIEIEPRTTYNGTFTLNISYGTIALNSLYLVLVSYNVKTDAGESVGTTKYAGARWLLTNGVFNRAYLTNSDSSTQDYNDFVTNTPASNSDGYNDNTCEGGYKRYEFKDSVKDLIRINLNSKWNQSYLNHNVEYKDLGVVWKDSDSALTDDKRYLSKKVVTITDTLLRLTVTDSINDNFPFELNTKSIKHDFNLNSDNKGGLSHDTLNIIGDVTALNALAGNIFTPDDDAEYGSNVIKETPNVDSKNNWLKLKVDKLDNACTLTMKSGIHSQIAGASEKRTLSYSDCYEKFMSDETFLSIFGYEKTDNPGVAIRVMFAREGGGTWHDDEWWLNSFILSGGSVIGPKELFYDSRHTDLHLLFADYLGQVSEEISNNMSAPVIAFMKGGGGLPNNSLIYNNLIETDSYILVFWRGVDGKYYIVDIARFNEDSRIIYKLMDLFKNIYIFKQGESTYKPEVYLINTSAASFVYMMDFEASMSANLDISCTKLNDQSVLYIKNSSNKYLDTLISNTETVLTNKNIINVNDTDKVSKVSKFVSGVWFVVNTNQSETKQYSEAITVKGTIEDNNTLSSLYEPVTNALISNNKVYTEDGDKVAFSPANIYYCGSDDKPYSVTSSNVDRKYAALAEQFSITTYKQKNQLLVNNVATRDIAIWSPFIGDDNSSGQLHFQGMPTVKLQDLPGVTGNFEKL